VCVRQKRVKCCGEFVIRNCRLAHFILFACTAVCLFAGLEDSPYFRLQQALNILFKLIALRLELQRILARATLLLKISDCLTQKFATVLLTYHEDCPKRLYFIQKLCRIYIYKNCGQRKKYLSISQSVINRVIYNGHPPDQKHPSLNHFCNSLASCFLSDLNIFIKSFILTTDSGKQEENERFMNDYWGCRFQFLAFL